MLEDMRTNISRLIALYEAQRQKAESLELSLERKEEEIRKYREQITDLNLQIDNLRLMSAFLAGTDNVQAKERISKLIREIDKCIKLLEN